MMYNNQKSDDDMLYSYLEQPRGPGTAWVFRFTTPDALVGTVINPLSKKKEKPFGKTIKVGLGTNDIRIARRERDRCLGIVRQAELEALKGGASSLIRATEIAAQLAELDDDDRHAWELSLKAEAKAMEPTVGIERASKFYRVATGYEVAGKPLKELFEDYRQKRQPPLSVTSVNNLKTAEREFLAFAGEDIELGGVDRKMVRRFVDDYLPQQRNARAPEGQGPATIAKKVTLLRGVWEWAKARDIFPEEAPNPWDRQGPRGNEIEAAKKPRRNYLPEEVIMLFAAKAEGTMLGDIMRIALLTGVRLEEIAGLDCSAVDPKARWYIVRKGKTNNATRVVPLVDVAQRIVLRRLEAVNQTGPLFPELPLRQSTGKRGGMVTQRFTELRREVLGRETDGELAQHSFRHTWRTAAGRAGVDLRHAQVMGGWSRGNASDAVYDHGLENEQYREQQEKVARWLNEKGYLGKPSPAS